MANIIECENLTKRYNKETCALDHLNFTIPDRGGIIGLLGPNGSGKTTFIKMLTGLLTPTEGSVKIAGYPVGVETKSIVSYLSDAHSLNERLSVRGELDYFEDFFPDFDRAKAERMIAELNIDENKTVRLLSKGTKEKLSLILTLSRNARVFILDEPIAGVDPAARDYILQTILSHKNADSTMIISTHLIAEIEEYFDYVVFLKEGSVALHGVTQEIRAQEGKSIDTLFREIFRWTNANGLPLLDSPFKEFEEGGNEPTMSASNEEIEAKPFVEQTPVSTEEALFEESSGAEAACVELPLPSTDYNKKGKLKKVRGRVIKKLFKVEFKYYWLLTLVVMGMVLLSSLYLGIVLRADFNAEVKDTHTSLFLILSAFLIFLFSLAGAGIFTSIYPLVRYNKNFFQNEGYLTFSIPASAEEHILAKRLFAVLCVVCVSVAMLLGMGIIGLLAGEFFDIGIDLERELILLLGIDTTSTFGTVMSVIEISLSYLISLLLVPSALGVISCALSKTVKSTTLVVVLLIFIGNSLVQTVISSVITFGTWFIPATVVGAHIASWVGILLQAALLFGCIFFEIWFLKKKLDLK